MTGLKEESAIHTCVSATQGLEFEISLASASCQAQGWPKSAADTVQSSAKTFAGLAADQAVPHLGIKAFPVWAVAAASACRCGQGFSGLT